jgi:hypothetical protein
MRRRVMWLVIVVAVLAAGTALDLVLRAPSSPRAKAPSDPFVGTWVLEPETRLVISKAAGGFLAVDSRVAPSEITVCPVSGRILCVRHGDELVGKKLLGGLPPAVAVAITYDAASDELTYASAAEGTFTLSRLVTIPGASAPPPSGGRADATFASRAFHFSISYDPARFEASPRPMPVNQQFNLVIFLRHPIAGLDRYYDFVYVTTARASASYVHAMLKTWGKPIVLTPVPTTLWADFVGAAGTHRWTTLGEVRTLKSEHRTSSERKVAYLLAAGDQVYAVDIQAKPRDWDAAVAALGPILRSFRITP